MNESLENTIRNEICLVQVDISQIEDHLERLRNRIHFLEEWVLDLNQDYVINKNFELRKGI